MKRVWSEDDATHNLPGHETTDAAWLRLRGTPFDKTAIVFEVDGGDHSTAYFADGWRVDWACDGGTIYAPVDPKPERTAAVPREKTRVVVCGTAFDGPAFVHVLVDHSKAQYDNGEHYDRAKEWAGENGLDRKSAMIAIDQHDRPGELFFDLFAWAIAPTVYVNP